MGLKTPLYHAHINAKGRMVEFAGFTLPVQYSGVIGEHMAVRTRAGLFDVSHMGEIQCTGKDSLANLQYMLTNDFSNMADGQARYSPMCNEKGGTVDDLIVYKREENNYFIVVNASNKDKDFQWMLEHQFGDVTFTDISDKIAQIALQGPKAMEILGKVTESKSIPEKYYTAVFDGNISGIDCIISRTGYTGEDGVEIYLDGEDAEKLWNLLLEAGKEEGLIPCGLGARDTLRLEAAMPLYGHELNSDTSPLECGLRFAVKMAKDDFIGKTAMLHNEENKRVRVGLKGIGRGIIRENAAVYLEDKIIGQTTSGTHFPFLGYSGAIALLNTNCATGTNVDVMTRNGKIKAEIVALPFYKRTN
ncbi:glycine cleavage system aminomethyltransferase GcvT [Anaerotignum sp.]|uniref:glycine cleavage system aminomethyltransferase GcvT n=1 Tax=Anaerotignum sp. TaxID=2039241 RepID=UPI00289D4FB7|nr:glycine cleavage system aminomethyltransferase GcvT [Anaerotignum sp.]